MRAFSEKQRFNQWWLILLIIVSFGIVGYSTFQDIQTLGLKSESQILKFIFGVLMTFIAFGLIFIFQLKTKINEQGIFYGFWPIQLTLRHVPWNEIEKVYVRDYSPISEYGGWGYRFSFKKHGKAYNVSGSTGIQIIFKDGRKTLIGTQKKEEVERVLNTYKNKLNENNH